jgi:hypothetical protein
VWAQLSVTTSLAQELCITAYQHNQIPHNCSCIVLSTFLRYLSHLYHDKKKYAMQTWWELQVTKRFRLPGLHQCWLACGLCIPPYIIMIIIIFPLLSLTGEIHNVAPREAPWCHGSDSNLWPHDQEADALPLELSGQVSSIPLYL